MKCFSVCFLLIISCIVSAQVEVVKLFPTNKAEFFNGDKAEIEISSNLNDDDLASFEGKQVAEKFYVISFYKQDTKRYFSTFVLNPPPPQKKNKKKVAGPEFILDSSFKIKFDKNRMGKDFYLMHAEYDPPVEKDYYQEIIVFLLLILVGLIAFFKFYHPFKKKEKLKKKKLATAESLIEKLDKVQSRQDFESIYAIKKELDSYLEVDKKVFKSFLKQLDSIQYKKNWTEQELADLKEIYKKMGDVRVKDGI